MLLVPLNRACANKIQQSVKTLFGVQVRLRLATALQSQVQTFVLLEIKYIERGTDTIARI